MAKKKAGIKKKAVTKKRAPAKKKTAVPRKKVAANAAAPGPPKRILDCLPSPDPESDWRVPDFEEADLPLPDDATLPKKVDLRADWWTINDQRDTGSCVGWALADSVLRWHFVRTEKIDKTYLLSPRFLWMAAKETDEFTKRPESFIESAGTSLKAALRVARNFGCIADTFLPFDSGQLYRGTSTSFYILAARYRILMYIRLQTLKEWQKWLAQKDNGPVLVRVEVDRTWHESPGGRLEHYDPLPAGHRNGGGHAAAIVGYTESGDFIFRNSWGTAWGDQGYAVASRHYANKAVTEAFGIVV